MSSQCSIILPALLRAAELLPFHSGLPSTTCATPPPSLPAGKPCPMRCEQHPRTAPAARCCLPGRTAAWAECCRTLRTSSTSPSSSSWRDAPPTRLGTRSCWWVLPGGRCPLVSWWPCRLSMWHAATVVQPSHISILCWCHYLSFRTSKAVAACGWSTLWSVGACWTGTRQHFAGPNCQLLPMLPIPGPLAALPRLHCGLGPDLEPRCATSADPALCRLHP